MTDRGSDSPSDESDRDPGDGGHGRGVASDGSSTPPDSPAGSSQPAEEATVGEEDAHSRPRRADTTADSRGPGPDCTAAVSIEDDGLVRWFLKTNNETVVYLRDIASSVGFVLLIALVLFGVSGVWPPLVAVESGSMEPNMERGDMIFVVDEDRFVGDGAIDGTGVVTAEIGGETGHSTFGNAGDVIIFRPGGSDFKTPVIHRAHFWVEEGENWVDSKADPAYLDGATCEELASCPARYSGFVTKGDANGGYDQHPRYGSDESAIVKPAWVEGKAAQRIPWLGYIRLTVDEIFSGTASPVHVSPFAAMAGGAVLSGRRV